MMETRSDFYSVKSGYMLNENGGECGVWFQRESEMARRVINFEESATRAALIKLGWTPPKPVDDNCNPV